MLFTPQHYGKRLENFSSKEKELFIIDGILTSLFNKLSSEGGDDNEGLRLFSGMLGRKRVILICEIMGYEFVEKSEELVEKIEGTKYGYKKFLRDINNNVEKMEEQERISQWN